MRPENQKNHNPAVGVFGHYGNENLGDEAIIVAVIQNLRERIPQAKIAGFSMRPDDTARRHGIPSYPIRMGAEPCMPSGSDLPVPISKPPSKETHSNPPKAAGPSLLSAVKMQIKSIPLLSLPLRGAMLIAKTAIKILRELTFLYKSLRILHTMDILLITGSNQFLDNFGGPWAFPYTLLKWSFLAKLAGARVCFISVGAGPITSPVSEKLIYLALLFSDYISLRDAPSRLLIQKTGFRGEAFVYPDLAHSLTYTLEKTRQVPTRDATECRPIVAINPMPLYDARYWCVADHGRYNHYLNKLARFCASLIRRGRYDVVFFGTQRRDELAIVDLLTILQERMGQNFDASERIIRSRSVDDLMNNLSRFDIVVATRFHGVVLSLLAEKPLIAICYYRKANDLMKEMGQGAYAVPFDSFTSDSLFTRLTQLEATRETAVEMIHQKNQAYRSSLDEQYNRLFGAKQRSSGG